MSRVIATVFALLLSAAPGFADSLICGPREVFIRGLSDNYAERARSLGLMPNGNVLEIFAADSGSFTVIVTDTSGRSCVLASGEGWGAINSTAVADAGPAI